MCIGQPLRVVETQGHMAWCEADGQREQLDMMLVGEQPVGTWVLEEACRQAKRVRRRITCRQPHGPALFFDHGKRRIRRAAALPGQSLCR